jgi:hypothetical protein
VRRALWAALYVAVGVVALGDTPPEAQRQADELAAVARADVARVRGVEPPAVTTRLVRRTSPGEAVGPRPLTPRGPEGGDALKRKATAWAFLGLLPSGTDLPAEAREATALTFASAYDAGGKTIRLAEEITPAGRQARRAAIEKEIGDVSGLEAVRRLNREWIALGEEEALESAHDYSGLRGALFLGLFAAAADRRHPRDELLRGDSTDMELALAALVEGDARLGSAEAQLSPDKAGSLLAALAKSYDALALRDDGKRPARFVRQVVDFPAVEGARFLSAVKKERDGGWPAVDALYDRPPLTTLAILHPEEFSTRSVRCFALRLPELDRFPGRKREPLWNDSLGALGVAYLLRGVYQDGRARGVLNAVDADRVAAGWRGDRYQLLADGGGRPLLAWVTVWRDADAARVFLDAYAKRLGWKYPGAVVVRSTADSYWLQRDARASFVTRTGPDGAAVIVGEEIPAESAADVESALGQADGAPLRKPAPAREPYVCPVHLDWPDKHTGTCPLCGRQRLRKEDDK